MIVYPAIDLKEGRVVRLHQGDIAKQTVYSDDPISTAKRWIDEGASWLHVINLDGAFSLKAAGKNERIAAQIAKLGVSVQFGGGLRSRADVQRAFAVGIKRIVLGTVAVQNPDEAGAIISDLGADAVAVALEVKDGKIATHGWVETSDITAAELGEKMYALGARHALYTDIARDGALTGVNVAAMVELAQQTQLQIIASGGVAGLADVKALRRSGQIAGVILGRALYAGTLNLRDALAAAAENV